MQCSYSLFREKIPFILPHLLLKIPLKIPISVRIHLVPWIPPLERM